MYRKTFQDFLFWWEGQNDPESLQALNDTPKLGRFSRAFRGWYPLYLVTHPTSSGVTRYFFQGLFRCLEVVAPDSGADLRGITLVAVGRGAGSRELGTAREI